MSRTSYAARRYMRTNIIQRGLLGRSRPWMVVFAGWLVMRGLGKVAKTGEAPVLFSEKLLEGEAFEIVHMAPPPTRRQRRRASRAR